MEETVIVIMEKDMKTGFLDKELCSFHINEYDSLLVNIFAEKQEDGLFIYMKLTTPDDVDDWQFNAIFDYYDAERLELMSMAVSEDDDCYNPTWNVAFKSPHDISELPEVILNILKTHDTELKSVYETIEQKKDEYTQ